MPSRKNVVGVQSHTYLANNKYQHFTAVVTFIIGQQIDPDKWPTKAIQNSTDREFVKMQGRNFTANIRHIGSEVKTQNRPIRKKSSTVNIKLNLI